MNKVFGTLGVVALALLLSGPGFAQSNAVPGGGIYLTRPAALLRRTLRVAQAYDEEGSYDSQGGVEVAIRPREAARIARQSMPGFRVLKVTLLPSGNYAVTLRGKGELTRVLIDGLSGDIL